MTTREIVPPVYRIMCDHPDGCRTMLQDTRYNSVRREAELAGWQIRPWVGKGSRTAPDLCPEHVTGGAS